MNRLIQLSTDLNATLYIQTQPLSSPLPTFPQLHKVTHYELLKLGCLLGYPLQEGICQGFSALLAQASLAQKEEEFFTRLYYIASYEGDLLKIKKEIDEIKVSYKNYGKILPRYSSSLEILAFYEGVELYMAPNRHQDLFNQGIVSYSSLDQIYPLACSRHAENRNFFILFDQSAAFDHRNLINYLQELAKILAETTKPLPLILACHNHSIYLKCLSKESWLYVDTNDFERYSAHPTYFRILTHAQLADSLFTSFAADKNVLFNTKILANHKIPKLETGLEALKKKYSFRPEQAFLSDSHHASLLYIAANNNDLSLVSSLLEQGADPNHTPFNGITPFYVCCVNGFLPLIREFLKYKVNINQQLLNGNTPLLAACGNGHLALVQELLKQKELQLNTFNLYGATPLGIACDKGHLEIVLALLKQKQINPNQRQELDHITPLHIACENGHLSIVKALLDHNDININLADRKGLTPCFYACYRGEVDILKILLQQKNLDPNLSSYSEGLTPLAVACSLGHLEIVRELLKDSGVDINQPDYSGASPFYIACQNGRFDIAVELLKQKELNPNQTQQQGESPFYIACKNGELNLVRRLLKEERININQRNHDHLSPVDIARVYGHSLIVEELLKHPSLILMQAQLAATTGPKSREAGTTFTLFLEKKKSVAPTPSKETAVIVNFA